jgi:hypothetical protein
MKGIPVRTLVPDTAVRDLVAELASLHPEDVAAILSNLDSDERQAIESYLQEHVGQFEVAVAASESAVLFDVSRLSVWLGAHLHAAGSGTAMTAHARASLQACAARLFPAAGHVP